MKWSITFTIFTYLLSFFEKIAPCVRFYWNKAASSLFWWYLFASQLLRHHILSRSFFSVRIAIHDKTFHSYENKRPHHWGFPNTYVSTFDLPVHWLLQSWVRLNLLSRQNKEVFSMEICIYWKSEKSKVAILWLLPLTISIHQKMCLFLVCYYWIFKYGV